MWVTGVQTCALPISGIVWGLYKFACMVPAEELAEGEFYKKIDDVKFFVHKVNEENIVAESLVS